MNKNDELNSIFQEKFESDTSTAPSFVWDELEGKLSSLRSKRRKRRMIAWFSLTGGALVTLLSINTLFSTHETPISAGKKDFSQKRIQHSFSQSNPQEDVLALKSNKDFFSNEEGQITFKEDYENKELHIDQKAELENTFVSTEKSDKPPLNSSLKKDSEALIPDNSIAFNHDKEIGEIDQPTNDKTDSTQTQFLDIIKERQTINSLDSSYQKDVKNVEDASLSLNQDISQVEKPQIKSINQNLLAPSPLILIDPIKTLSKWEISFNYSIGRQVRRTNLNQDDIYSNNFSGKSPTRQIFSTYGVKANYTFGKHLSIGFGFETSIWKYRTRNYQKELIYSTQYEFDSPVGRLTADEHEFKSFYPAGSTTDTITLNLSMFQRLRYVGIPFHLKYDFGKGKFRPYVKFGFISNFLVRQRTILYAKSTGGIEREVNYKNIDGFKKFQLTLQPALGLNWRVNDKISFFGEGLLNLPVTKIYTAPNSGLQSIRSQGRGVNLGIKFRLN